MPKMDMTIDRVAIMRMFVATNRKTRLAIFILKSSFFNLLPGMKIFSRIHNAKLFS